MSDPIQFRYAQPEDAEQIVDLVESGYRGERSRQGWTTEAAFLQGQRTDMVSVSELIRTAGSLILLAEQGGCCWLARTCNATRSTPISVCFRFVRIARTPALAGKCWARPNGLRVPNGAWRKCG